MDLQSRRPGVKLFGVERLKYGMQRERHLDRRTRPLYRFARKARHDDPLQERMKIDDVAERLGLLDELRVSRVALRRVRVALGKWTHSRESFVEGHSERKEIALRGHFTMNALLRRHVGQGSERVSESHRPRITLREREVEQTRRIAHGHVVRLHIEMQNVARVEVMKRAQHPYAEQARFRDAHRTDLVEVLCDGLGRDVFEDHVGTGRCGVPSEQPDEVGMLKSRGDGCLAETAIDEAVCLDPMSPNDVGGDLEEEKAIPSAEYLVPGPSAEELDHDERSIELATRVEVPALLDCSRLRCHSLILRSSECARRVPRHRNEGSLAREPSLRHWLKTSTS